MFLTYTVLTSDQKHIFINLSPYSLDEEMSFLRPEEEEKVKAIRDKYPSTGLYRNDGSTEPLWNIDGYPFDVHVHSDAKHLVIPGPWPMSYDFYAVSFFSDGKLVRFYRVYELVQFPQLLPRSVSHFRWREETKFNEEEKTYEIETLHGEKYVFDITTGDIIEHTQPDWMRTKGSPPYTFIPAGGNMTPHQTIRQRN